ncbi:MAG: hypothetical protein ABSF50_17280 [Burkholderiaceae bacterium]|jgi:hypothetical protein
MKPLLASLLLLIWASPVFAAGDIVESIPNQNGGWSTLYDQNSEKCQGSNHLAVASDAQGNVTAKGCWQAYADGYMVYATEGARSVEIIQFSHALIARLKAAREEQPAPPPHALNSMVHQLIN